MSKILGSLVMVVALSFLGLPSAMANDQSPAKVQRDDDKDKDKDQKHRRHHRRHHRHHHHRHHKHTPPKTDGTSTTTPPNS
ncbi:MAG TPA: hypothetical protein VKW04_24575 [Planctomycetota bacterium]|jgi:Ni/Co efflux regulator RcnB|nr:hypothetical protein [Planctomycetota bacterium]